MASRRLPESPGRSRRSAATAPLRPDPAGRSRTGSPRMPWLLPRFRRDNRRSTHTIAPKSLARLGRGELLLPLPKCLLGATTSPVPGDRRPFGIDSTLVADIGPQVVHDGLRLTVNEDLHLAR